MEVGLVWADLQRGYGGPVLLLPLLSLQSVVLSPEQLLLQVLHYPQHLLQLCILTYKRGLGRRIGTVREGGGGGAGRSCVCDAGVGPCA